MTKFYQSTKYLWIVSRILLIILFSAAISNRIKETTMSDIIVSSVFIMVIFLLIVLAIMGFLKKKAHYVLHFMVGILITLFGILCSYLLLTFGETKYAVHIKMGFQLAPLWIVLYGIYEITNGINSLKIKQD
ncbi:hypothetical protein SAMN05216480_10243 [Pustulibacterium marinum]|uniref:Uncharacterized protein n=2 Tax=Pustulibacterium marinum TaxID=1224947 RepID=A0A1I7FMU2_9FLAO|nr:hypothetical protein SAMN05216480_10243 [Pustulibacterium marinum]